MDGARTGPVFGSWTGCEAATVSRGPPTADAPVLWSGRLAQTELLGELVPNWPTVCVSVAAGCSCRRHPTDGDSPDRCRWPPAVRGSGVVCEGAPAAVCVSLLPPPPPLNVS